MPTLALVEVAAALSRARHAPSLAQQVALAIGQLPNVVLVPLDDGLARQSAALGAQHGLRGADAVFLASAAVFAAELVTLDREQLQRGARVVQTLPPATFLKTVSWVWSGQVARGGASWRAFGTGAGPGRPRAG